MYQRRYTAKNSWWWSERLPETCRVVIPTEMEFSASVDFIHKEFVTMHGHTIFKKKFLYRLYGGYAFFSCFTLHAIFQKCSQCIYRGQPRIVPYFTRISLQSTGKRVFRVPLRSSWEVGYYAANGGNFWLTFGENISILLSGLENPKLPLLAV